MGSTTGIGISSKFLRATNNVQYLNHDARYTRDGGSPHSPSTASSTAFDRAFTAKMQAEYRTLDTRRVPQVQCLQTSPHTDRTVAMQLSVHSMLDALSRIFDVADPSGSVTMRSPTWVSGWHAPLLNSQRPQSLPTATTGMHCTASSMTSSPNCRKG